MAILESLVGGATAGAVSGIAGLAGAAVQDKYTKENMKLANQYNRQNTLDSAMLNVQGLKQAGLNPALAQGGDYSVAGVSNVEGARPDMSGIAGAAMQGAMLESTIELQDSNAAKAREDAEAQKLKNDEEKSRREMFTIEYVGRMQKVVDNPKADEHLKSYAEMVVESSKNENAPLYNKGILQGMQDFKDYDKLASDAETGVLENAVRGAIAKLQAENGHVESVAKMSQAELTKITASTILFMADANLKAQQEAESNVRTNLVLPAQANELQSLAEKYRQECIKEYHTDPWAMWDNGEKGKAVLSKTEDVFGMVLDVAGLALGFKSAAAFKGAQAVKQLAEDARQQKSFDHDTMLSREKRAYQTKREKAKYEHEKEMERLRHSRTHRKNIYNGQGRLTGSVVDYDEE